MSITYPNSRQADRFARPVLAPTPELRAQAAIGEALDHFAGIARAGGLIGVFLLMSLSSTVEAEGYLKIWLILALFIVSVSFSLLAPDFRVARKRAKFLSGIADDGLKSRFFNWVRWAAFIGATAGGVACLIWHKEIRLSFGDGVVVSSLLLIMGQLVSIMLDTLQGAKLLHYARMQREDVVQPQVGEPHH